jgi:hypothetical protein
VGWIQLAGGSLQWLALLKAVVYIWIVLMWRQLSIIPETIGFSRRTLLHGIRCGEFVCFLSCLHGAKQNVPLPFNFPFFVVQ